MPIKHIRSTEPAWKHPDENKIYVLDFTAVLNGSNVSAISNVTVPTGLTGGTSAIAGPYREQFTDRQVDGAKAVRFQIEGGVAGTDYDVEVKVLAADGSVHVGVQEFRVRTE